MANSRRIEYVSGVSAPTSRIWLHTHNGFGSSSTHIPRYTTTVINSGSDITYADSASLGSTFTINTAGIYAISCQIPGPIASHAYVGISLNSSELTTPVQSITAANRLAINRTTAAGGERFFPVAHITFYLAVNDVIRPHTDGQTPFDNGLAGFKIQRVT